MIARLRAWHRRVWIVLVVVAPVVIAEARSVRRGEAARQELPPTLGVSASDDGVFGENLVRSTQTSLEPDPTSGALMLEVRQTPPLLFYVNEPDSLLYWSQKSNAAIDQLLDFDFSTNSIDDLARLEEAVDRSPLPTDAMLLGPWTHAAVQRFAVPDDFRGGVLIEYSLGRSHIQEVSFAPYSLGRRR